MPVAEPICPRCRAALEQRLDLLDCGGCGAAYDVVDGVPILLPRSLSRQQMSQAQYFDAQFEAFPTAYAPENWRLSFVRRIFRSLGIKRGQGPYLDVGVGGVGATVIEAARLGVESMGCDLSIPGVLNANKLAHGESVERHARFVACAAESLPFPDDTFACASAVAVLEHVDDDPKAAAELARVMRPGGRLWITVPVAYRYILPPLWLVYAWHDRKLGHKRHYDEAAIVRLLGGVGLVEDETTYTGHAVKVLQLILDRLVPSSKPRGSRIWWRLEHLDLRAAHRPYGALQLNAVFRKPERQTAS